MRFMLLQHYAPAENCGVPMYEWRPEDIQAHIAFQQALNAELLGTGELVDAQGLSDQARTVTNTGTVPAIVDGPFPETKELLAGYRLIDVDTLDRALEIAARASAAPGPNGVPIGDHIEVREVMGAPMPNEV
ncbi:MAG TPA: YciI family protein [Acidimicrobiales bacterium]